MKTLKAERTVYEIGELLGEGLTGQVYKAFRVDSRGQTRHRVALKILRSQISVQVLRREFHRLEKIRSPHCIQLLGWENFSSGPALVLEYLQGLTLHQLALRTPLDKKIADEIIAQAQRGLTDLHAAGIVHGDLNSKNIFLTKTGRLKILDFGVLGRSKEVLATPQFMAPELWEGQKVSESSDYFSLGLVYQDMLSNSLNEQKSNEYWKKRSQNAVGQNSLLLPMGKRKKIKCSSHPLAKKKLAQQIERAMNDKSSVTQILSHKRRRGAVLKKSISAACFCFLSFNPQWEAGEALGYKLTIRSENWTKLSINGLPTQYTPIELRGLRPGSYGFRWESKDSSGKRQVRLHRDQLFLLQPDNILLK